MLDRFQKLYYDGVNICLEEIQKINPRRLIFPGGSACYMANDISQLADRRSLQIPEMIRLKSHNDSRRYVLDLKNLYGGLFPDDDLWMEDHAITGGKILYLTSKECEGGCGFNLSETQFIVLAAQELTIFNPNVKVIIRNGDLACYLHGERFTPMWDRDLD
jgi:hypothetical protein